MCVLRDHFSAIIGQFFKKHYPRSIDEATSFKSFKISLFQDTCIFIYVQLCKGK